MRSIILNIEANAPLDLSQYVIENFQPPFILIIDKDNRSRIYTMDWLLKNREERAIKIVFETTRMYYA